MIFEERAEIEEKRRIIAEERARLNEEKKKRGKIVEEEKKTEDNQARLDGGEGVNEKVENRDSNTKLSEDEQKAKERMKEIQRLAREQARFEIQARGLPEEERSLKEKDRMDRLQQLAREQAQYEYDRRHANDKRNEQNKSFRSTNTASRNENVISRRKENRVPSDAPSKERYVKAEEVGQRSLFQTADTPSNEENMQNRVRHEFSKATDGKRVQQLEIDRMQNRASQFQSADIPSNEEKIQDRVRQFRETSDEEDVLMGTKKRVQDRGTTLKSERTSSKEGMRRENARLDQLESLAKKQAQYRTDRTSSTNACPSRKDMSNEDLFDEKSEGQIIDVEVAEDNVRDILSSEDARKDIKGGKGTELKVSRLERKDNDTPEDSKDKTKERAQLLSRQQKIEKKTTSVENENKKNGEKQRQLEAQARLRSKQQFIRNERLYSEKNDIASSKGVAFDAAAVRANTIDEPVRRDQMAQHALDSESRFPQQVGMTKQQKEVASAVMKSDGSYEPSEQALAKTSMMLKEVCGLSLSEYKGSKEFLYRKSNVSVYVGRALSIPVRITTPGSFVEFSINKKGSEFDFAILAVPDKGYPVDLKRLAPFTKYVGKGQTLLRDTVLVGAASAPCTLQFKFENSQSTLLDKVMISYDIKVTSPSSELLLEARRLRTESCLQVIEEDIRGLAGGSNQSALRDEIAEFEAKIEEKIKEIDTLMDEERRWNALIAKINSATP